MNVIIGPGVMIFLLYVVLFLLYFYYFVSNSRVVSRKMGNYIKITHSLLDPGVSICLVSS